MQNLLERVFAAIPAIYSGGHTAKLGRANYTINIFRTDEESMLFTAWILQELCGAGHPLF